MSVKRIILGIIAFGIVGSFIYTGAVSLAKTNDKNLKQEMEIKDTTLDLKKLETKEEKLEKERLKAEQDKASHEQELQKSQQQQEELLKKRKELEAQLQANLDNKNKIALASANKTEVTSSVTFGIESDNITTIIAHASNKYDMRLSPPYNLEILCS